MTLFKLRSLHDLTGHTAPVTPRDLGALDRRTLVFDQWHFVRQDYGNFTVSVETDDREHHMTVRAEAQKFVTENLGPGWKICAYLGRENYRNFQGYASWARRYSVVYVGASQ